MRVRIKTLTIAVATLGVLALPTAALAYAPSGNSFVSCSPDPVEAGDTVAVSGGLFDPGTDVDMVATSGGETLADADAKAGANGTVAFSVDVADDTDAGDATITLTGTRNGDDETVVGTCEIVDAEVAADGDEADELADTGSETGLLGAAALAAIALGGGALYASRRTRTTA